MSRSITTATLDIEKRAGAAPQQHGKSKTLFGGNRINHLNIHMIMNRNCHIHIDIFIDIRIRIHFHIMMNRKIYIHIDNTILAGALRVLTCSRILSAPASRDSECGCKSSSS